MNRDDARVGARVTWVEPAPSGPFLGTLLGLLYGDRAYLRCDAPAGQWWVTSLTCGCSRRRPPMDRDQAVPGARVTWAGTDGEDDPGGTVVAVNAEYVAVKWDGPTAHHVSDLRLLPDEAQP